MSRYGIGEWYGRPLLALSPDERRRRAATALSTRGNAPACPFAGMQCSKQGGVCSLQRYEESGEPAGEPVIVCPARFDEDGQLLRWLADIVGFQHETAYVAREVPFMMNRITNKAAGRIDIVLAHTEDAAMWFGLEVQAVYFSGPSMSVEFERLRKSPDSPYPSRLRRPDWRSSSAKRLMPQLQVKGPTLRRWGSKIAVAVDRPFFDAIGGPSPRPSHDPNDGDVLWLVPEIHDHRMVQGHWEVLTLEASTDKLLAAHTVQRGEFEADLRQRLRPMLD